MSTTTISSPVLVKNTKLGPTVFRDDETGAEVTWQGAGDPMGEDVQTVPQKFLQSNQFLMSLSRGTFEIEQAPDDVVESLAEYLNSPSLKRQAATAAAKREAATHTALETIDHAADNDIVAVKCIGPDSRGTGECNVDIPVNERGKTDRPPLCAIHRSLAGQFVPVESKELVNGKTVQKWIRAGLAPKQQYQSVSD